MADAEDTVARLAIELNKKILPTGLPVRYETVGPELLKLVGFTGDLATTAADEVLPYVAKANDLVRYHLETFDNDELGDATRILFGYTAGCRGTQVGIREQRAATLCDRTQSTIHNWRKKICLLLAWQMYRDSLPPSLSQ